MKTYILTAKNISGINGIYVREGNQTFEFDGILRYEKYEKKCHFIVSNIEEGKADNTIWAKALNAIKFVLFETNGLLDIYSITNIKQYN